MLKNLRRDDGLFTRYITLKPERKRIRHGNGRAKAEAIILDNLRSVDLFNVTGEVKYKKASISLCEKILEFQESAGRFVTSRKDNSTHMHPHAYSAEGLLYTGYYLDREDFIEAALKAVKMVVR